MLSTKSNSNILPFCAPAPKVPDKNASIADKLQWVTIHYPSDMERIHRQVETICRKHRTTKRSPVPAIVLELTRDLEYRTIRVNEPDALLMSPRTDLMIGRKAYDVVPGALVEQFDRAAHEARATRRPVTFSYEHHDGQVWRRRVICPTPDLIIGYVEHAEGT